MLQFGADLVVLWHVLCCLTFFHFSYHHCSNFWSHAPCHEIALWTAPWVPGSSIRPHVIVKMTFFTASHSNHVPVPIPGIILAIVLRGNWYTLQRAYVSCIWPMTLVWWLYHEKSFEGCFMYLQYWMNMSDVGHYWSDTSWETLFPRNRISCPVYVLYVKEILRKISWAPKFVKKFLWKKKENK